MGKRELGLSLWLRLLVLAVIVVVGSSGFELILASGAATPSLRREKVSVPNVDEADGTLWDGFLVEGLEGLESRRSKRVTSFEETRVLPSVNIVTQRVGFSAVITMDKVFVLGGFFHASQGGDSVDFVSVFSFNGTELEPLSAQMITPRGNMATVLLSETLIVTIGGSTSITGEALPNVETPDLSVPGGKWSSWTPLSAPRQNATAAPAFGGVLVALGGSSLATEWWSSTGQGPKGLASLPADLPSECFEKGVLAGYTEAILFLCPLLNGTTLFYYLESLTSEWTFVPAGELGTFSFQSLAVASVNAQSTILVGQTFLGLLQSLSFRNGSVTTSQCALGFPCSGTVLLGEASWVCLTTEVQQPPLPWSQYGGNPQRTFLSLGNETSCLYLGEIGQPSLIWATPFRVQKGDSVLSMAIASNGMIVVGVQSGDIYALDARTGELMWLQSVPASPEVILIGLNDTIYAGGAAITASGELLSWSRPESRFVGISQTQVFLASNESIAAIDALTGEVRWNWTIPFGNAGEPVTAIDLGGSIYCLVTNAVYSLDGPTGILLWTYNALLGLASQIAISRDGTVYVSISGSRMLAIDGATGSLLWKTVVEGNSVPFPAIGVGFNQSVYRFYGEQSAILDGLTGNTRGLFPVAPASGVLNELHVYGPFWGTGADGTLYYRGNIGEGSYFTNFLLALDPLDSTVKWVSPIFAQTAAMGSDGTFYLAMYQDQSIVVAAYGDTTKAFWETVELTPTL